MVSGYHSRRGEGGLGEADAEADAEAGLAQPGRIAKHGQGKPQAPANAPGPVASSPWNRETAELLQLPRPTETLSSVTAAYRDSARPTSVDAAPTEIAAVLTMVPVKYEAPPRVAAP